MTTTYSRLVNNWEQAVRTHLVDKLGYVSISAVPVTLTETHHVNQVSNLRLVYILYLQLSGSFVFLPIFFTLHKITLTVNFLQNCHCEQSWINRKNYFSSKHFTLQFLPWFERLGSTWRIYNCLEYFQSNKLTTSPKITYHSFSQIYTTLA